MQQARTHRIGCCLSGNTKVRFGYSSLSQQEKYYEETIEKLANLWHYGSKNQQTSKDAKDMQESISSCTIFTLDTKINQIVSSKITNIYINGEKETYTIKTFSGKEIRATLEHQFWTNQGWKRLKDFNNSTQLCEMQLVSNKITPQEIKFLEKEMFDEKWIPAKNYDSFSDNCGIFVEIKSIEKFGKEITYDIEVEHPEHNFIANGLVVHNSFDVQSYRFCSGKVIAVAEGKTDIETAFYLRPVGKYSDRQGKKYYYSIEQREKDLQWCLEAAKKYKLDMEFGMSEEHARGKIPFDYRQHFVVSFNCRSLLHFLDLRFKRNAQLEIQKLCDLMLPHVQDWIPNIAEWYEKNRLGKAKLAP